MLGLDADNRAATTIDIAEQVALIFVRGGAFDLHERFEQNGAGFFEGVFQGENTRHAEREFIRVHFMERAVHDLNFDIDDLVAGIDAAFNGFLDAVDDGRDVFLGNGAADNFIDDFDPLALFIGCDGDTGVAVLALTAGLTDELAFALGVFGDRLAIGDLRRAGVGLDLNSRLSRSMMISRCNSPMPAMMS